MPKRNESNVEAVVNSQWNFIRCERRPLTLTGLTPSPLYCCHQFGGAETSRFSSATPFPLRFWNWFADQKRCIYLNRWIRFAVVSILLITGCGEPQSKPPQPSQLGTLGLPSDTNINVKEVRYADGLEPLVQFETVFWEPPDTKSLRKLIFETDLVHDKAVLEIGSGTGLISLCCLQSGATQRF